MSELHMSEQQYHEIKYLKARIAELESGVLLAHMQLREATDNNLAYQTRIAYLEQQRATLVERNTALVFAAIRTARKSPDAHPHTVRLARITKWLEENQPDVFKRGLWDAVESIASTDKGDSQS